MHHEFDRRHPVEIPPDQLADAPAWALRLVHNVEFLVGRVSELEAEVERLQRRLDSMATAQEVLMAAGQIPGES